MIPPAVAAILKHFDRIHVELSLIKHEVDTLPCIDSAVKYEDFELKTLSSMNRFRKYLEGEYGSNKSKD